MVFPRSLFESWLCVAVLATHGQAQAQPRAAGDGHTHYSLPNGLRVRLVPSRDEKKVVVLLGVRAGFFEEPAGLPHLAHVVEHLTVFGAPAGSEEARALERWYMAGQANAETLAEVMYFDLYVDPGELDLALRVQAARLARAEFTHEVLDREIPRTLSELEFLEKSEQGGTGKFAYSAFVQSVLHGRDDVPIKARTRAITVVDVREFHRRTFQPDRAVLYVVGDFDAAQARKEIDKAFGDLFGATSLPSKPRSQSKPGAQTAHWDVATRHVVLGWPAPPASDPDHGALTLAAQLLHQRLYQDEGVMALTKAHMVSNEVEGFFLVNLQARDKADLDSLIKQVQEHTARLAQPSVWNDLRVSTERLDLMYMMSPAFVQLRSVVLAPEVSRLKVRTNIELQKLVRELPWGDLDAYMKRVESVSGPAARKAVARYLDTKRTISVRIEPKS